MVWIRASVIWEGCIGWRSIWRVDLSMTMLSFESVITRAVEELAGSKASSSSAGIVNSSGSFTGISTCASSSCTGSAGSCA